MFHDQTMYRESRKTKEQPAHQIVNPEQFKECMEHPYKLRNHALNLFNESKVPHQACYGLESLQHLQSFYDQVKNSLIINK